MRPPSHVSILAAMTATAVAACSHTVSPGGQPSLDDETGIVVLVIDTDTPLKNINFNRVNEFEGFSVGFADRGRSVHLFKVPAERYRLADFDSGTEEFTPEAGGELCVQVEPGQMNYPGHFVFRSPQKKNGLRTYANWQWRQDFEDMKRRVTIEWTDLLAAYPVESTACP